MKRHFGSGNETQGHIISEDGVGVIEYRDVTDEYIQQLEELEKKESDQFKVGMTENKEAK